METNENNLTDVQKNTRTTILSLTNNFAEKRNEYIKKAEELKKEALELEKTTNGDYEYTEGSLSFNKALIKGYILGTYYGKAISALENSISIEIFKVHLSESFVK